MEKHTLPSIRISIDTINNMKSALSKFNEKQVVELSMQDFRRLAYELISQTILQGKQLNIKLKK